MFEGLKRLQLQRRGFSSGKTRRKNTDSEFLESLRCSRCFKALVFGLFLAAIGTLITYAPAERAEFVAHPFKAVLVAAIIIVTALIQLYVNHPFTYANNWRVAILLGAICLHLAVVKAIIVAAANNTLPENYAFLLIPYALAPMSISVLMGRNHGIFTAVYISLLGCLLLDANSAFPFIVQSMVCGFVAVYVTDQIRRRIRLLRAGLYVGLSGAVLAVALGHIQTGFLSGFQIEFQHIAFEASLPLLIGIFTGMFVGGVLPVLESALKITTDISWLELADLNHPLLKKMILEAPGTYHHSLIVASLSEAAAEAVGANAIMCRVCSYFHDIGKLNKSGYFIENISPDDNPHDDLTSTMSALVIVAHVKDGVDLAVKNKLNDRIIDVIEQHHGDSLVYYFYRQALTQRDEIKALVAEGKASEEDIPEVSEKSFRYPGPRPQFKESAIISIADAVESASRSLQKPTPQKIGQLVEDIVSSRINDNQLDECDLTLHELCVVKQTLTRTLSSMLHNRVSYPKVDKKERPDRESRGGHSSQKIDSSEPKKKSSPGGKDEGRKKPPVGNAA